MRFVASSLLLGFSVLPTLLASQTNTDSAAAMPDTTRVGPRPGEALTPSMAQWLVGRFPGVLVYPSSGTAGTGARIRIRGSGSLALSNEPALYVDGVRVEGHERGLTFGSNGEWTSSAAGRLTSRLNDLNPEDVDSIVIVRGPAAGVMYGPEVAAGAILLYTHQGHAGPARWRAYVEQGGVSDVSHWPANYRGVDSDNPDSFYRLGGCTLQAEADGRCEQDFVTSATSLLAREQFRAAPRRQYGLRVSGRRGRLRYAVGGELESESGIYELSDAEVDRLVAAGGSDAASEDVIHPSHLRRFSLYGNFAIALGQGADAGLTIFRRAIDVRLPPATALMYGGLLGASEAPTLDGQYPFRPAELFQRVEFHQVERLGGSVRFAWRPAHFLEISGLAGFDDVDQQDHPRPQPSSLSDHQASVGRQNYSLGANLRFGLSGTLSGRTRLSVQHLDYELDAHMIRAFWSPADTSLRSSEEVRLYPDQSTTSVAAEQEVTWRERLTLGVGVRHSDLEAQTPGLEGGYVVGPFPPSPAPATSEPGSKWYPFARLAWLPIAAPHGPVERLDLRWSYGTAGRRIGSVATERTAEVEFGATATFLGGRANLAVQAYSRRTSDALAEIPVSTSYGYFTTVVPGAGISNRGLEVSLTAVPARGANWSWDVTLGIWGNRNRLTTLPGPPLLTARVGYPVGGYWGRQILGYADDNTDGIIDSSEVTLSDSWEWLGSTWPTQGATLASGLALGNRVRIGGLLEYRAGHALLNQTALERCRARVCRETQDRTTPLGRQAAAAVRLETPAGFIEDADYLKLRELSLTVTAPASVSRAVRAQNLRLTLAGRNLATWTGYTGLDPEVNSDAQSGDLPYRDRFAQPPVRYWTLRLDMEF